MFDLTRADELAPGWGCRKGRAACHRSLAERQNPISIRRFLLVALAVALSGSGWGRRSGLAGQEQHAPSEEPEPVLQVGGQVVEYESGDPITGAAVSLGAGPRGTRGLGTRVTGEDGRFLFRSVPPGVYRLYVTTQGYRRMSDTLQVSPGEDLELVLPLSRDPVRLEPIIVTAERRPPPRRDWERRARSRSVFLVTREEIEKRDPNRMSDLLNRVPGGIVVPTPPYGYTLLLRGQCRPGIWLDGVKVPHVSSIDQLMSPHDVEAIEVYHGFELPVEFGVDPCGGILIWTRMGRPDPPGDEKGRVEIHTPERPDCSKAPGTSPGPSPAFQTIRQRPDRTDRFVSGKSNRTLRCLVLVPFSS